MPELQEVIQQLFDRIEDIEYELYEIRSDSEGNGVYVYEYPIPSDYIMFIPSDTYNAPEIQLSETHEFRYT